MLNVCDVSRRFSVRNVTLMFYESESGLDSSLNELLKRRVTFKYNVWISEICLYIHIFISFWIAFALFV